MSNECKGRRAEELGILTPFFSSASGHDVQHLKTKDKFVIDKKHEETEEDLFGTQVLTNTKHITYFF